MSRKNSKEFGKNYFLEFCHSCPDFHRDKLQQESRVFGFRRGEYLDSGFRRSDGLVAFYGTLENKGSDGEAKEE